MEKTLVLTPILSEKAYALSQARNTYVFKVPKPANKHSIANAVKAQFNVEVENVNIANIAGKAKRTVRKSGRAVKGRQSDIHKAYVTLRQGHSLPVFAALEQAAEADDDQNDKPVAKPVKRKEA